MEISGIGSLLVLQRKKQKQGMPKMPVPLNSTAMRILDSQEISESGHYFTYKGRPISRMLNTGWKKAREEIGLPNLRVHDLRHTFASRLMQRGVSLEHRRVLLGHSTNGTPTELYSHADLADLFSSVELISSRPKKEGMSYLKVV